MQGLKPLQTKALLGSLLALVTFATVCRAHCFALPVGQSEGDSPTECTFFYGIKYPMNSTWNLGPCINCSCDENGIQCCNLVEVPVYYDKLNCRVMFDATTCNFVITYRREPWKNCPVYDRILDVLKDPSYQPIASPSSDEENL